MNKIITTVFASMIAMSGNAMAEDLQLTIVNNSALDLVAFFTSPTDVASWEQDVFGQNVLLSGGTGTVNIADGRDTCDYDVRMVFSDNSIIEGSTNICENNVFEITSEMPVISGTEAQALMEEWGYTYEEAIEETVLEEEVVEEETMTEETYEEEVIEEETMEEEVIEEDTSEEVVEE